MYLYIQIHVLLHLLGPRDVSVLSQDAAFLLELLVRQLLTQLPEPSLVFLSLCVVGFGLKRLTKQQERAIVLYSLS